MIIISHFLAGSLCRSALSLFRTPFLRTGHTDSHLCLFSDQASAAEVGVCSEGDGEHKEEL